MGIKISHSPGVQPAYHAPRPPKPTPQTAQPSERAKDTVDISEYGRRISAKEAGLTAPAHPAGEPFGEEELSQAATEVVLAQFSRLPGDHTFSPEFERKMDELMRSIGQQS